MKPQHENLITSRPKIKGLKADILGILERNGQCCSCEIQLLLNKDGLSPVCKRLSELENEGLVYRTGNTMRRRGMKYDEFAITPKADVQTWKQFRHDKRRADWLKQGLNKGYINQFTFDFMTTP